MKKLLAFLLSAIFVFSSFPILAFSENTNPSDAQASECEHIFDQWNDCVLCGYSIGYCDECVFDRSTHLCTVCSEPCYHYDDVAEDYSFVDGVCSFCGAVEATIWDGESVAENFAGGTGTKEDPYLISNGAELFYFAELVRDGETFESKYITLVSDIDLDHCYFPSIGITDYTAMYFAGCFDGAGHTVFGFCNTEYGLFGEVRGGYSDEPDDCGTIKNLNVIGEVSANSDEQTSYDMGGILGRGERATIINCSFTGSIYVGTPGFYYYGGIAGEMEQGEIRDCSSNTMIYTYSDYRGIGGILGGAEYNPPLIENCENLGNIMAQTNYMPVGGIVGKGDKVINCSNSGAVLAFSNTSNPTIAGIAGNANEIINCYNTGTVGTDPNTSIYGGTILGIGDAEVVRNCYNMGEFIFTLEDGYTCNDSYDILSSNLVVSGTAGIGGSEDSIIENCYAIASDYPTYIDYAEKYNQEYDYSYWEHVPVFDNQKTAEEMASAEFASALNTGASAIGNITYRDFWGNDNSIPLKSWKSNGSFPVFGVAEEKMTLEVFSAAKDGTAIGEVFMEGTASSFEVGDVITLSAIYDGVDYRFIGWYANGDLSTVIANSKGLSFHVTEEMVKAGKYTVTALYEKADAARITVNGGNLFTVEGSEYSSQVVKDFRPSKPITLHAKDENFAYWVIGEGRIVSYEPRYTFIVAYDLTLTAVFNTKLENKYTVMFVSDYDQVIYRSQLTLEEIEALELPRVPVKAGYDAGSWSYDAAAILEQAKAGNDVIIVKPTYPEIEKTANITVSGGTLKDGSTEGTVNVNDVVTVIANAADDGMKFAYWQNQNGRIISYNKEYSFIAEKDVTLTAVYSPDEDHEQLGVADITSISKQESVNGISFTATFSIPEGGKIDFAGIVATSDASKAEALTTENADYIRGGAQDELSGRFTWTKSNVSDTDTWYVRAYLVYTDASGVSHTVYSSLASASYNTI